MPRIISFAKTLTAFHLNAKTVTRRNWKEKYATSIRAGDIMDAWDKLPRAHGKFIGQIRILVAPYRQKNSEMTDEHFIREGGFIHWKSKAELIEMLGPNESYWVVEFERI